jgi:hypothetical protein
MTWRGEVWDPNFPIPEDSPQATSGRPGDVMGRAMSTDAHEELFRLLGDVAEECPLPVLADVTLMLATVQARRLHDELFEFSVRDQDIAN